MSSMILCRSGVAGWDLAGTWVRLLADESGQDLIEYGLILAFLALGTVATMKGLALSLGTFFGSLGSTLTSSV